MIDHEASTTAPRFSASHHHHHNNHESPTTTAPVRVRERQWMYLGPIAAAPLAHIAVTLYRDAKTVRQKQALFAIGILGSTIMTLGMRLALMQHAGYPGGPNLHVAQREKVVSSLDEKDKMENPSVWQVARQAFRGFG